MEKETTFPENFNVSEKKHVLIATFHEIKENILLNFIYDIKKEVFDQETFEEIEELESETAKNIVAIINDLNTNYDKHINNKGYLEKLEISKKHMINLNKRLEPFVSEIIKEQIDKSNKRINETLFEFDKLLIGRENEFFIIIFPEAFFNYFRNPKGFGNFIPFMDENPWNSIFIEWSIKHKNILLIPNIIYIDRSKKREYYKENFEYFIKNSYKQHHILSAYDTYIDAIENTHNIINESFVYFNGEVLYRNQKRFILDEDIPLEMDSNNNSYLGTGKYLYIPGIEKQPCSNLLDIQICQDHMNIEPTFNSIFFLLQSASISFSYYKFKGFDEMYKKSKYVLYIHADVDEGACAIMRLPHGAATPQILESTSAHFNLLEDIVKIKCYNVTEEVGLNLEEQS